MSIAYLNGKFLPIEEANLSVMDRGLLFADGIFEVIPVYNTKPFRLEDHLKRFAMGLGAIYIEFDTNSFKEIIRGLLIRNEFQAEQAIYLQVTRGVALVRDHKIPQSSTPSVFGFCMPMPARNREAIARGVSVITVEDIRWGRCDIKSINLLPNVLMCQKAVEASADEALFVADGLVFEGTSTNLFIVKKGKIITPPLGKKVLGGVTREIVLELARENSIPSFEEGIREEELLLADEIWLTSSTKEILPVTRVNKHAVNKGMVGPLWSELMSYYQDYKNNLLQS